MLSVINVRLSAGLAQAAAFRLLNRALGRFAWEAAVTGGRIWNPSSAPTVAAMRCPGGGFAVALGYRWEVTISPLEYRPRA